MAAKRQQTSDPIIDIYVAMVEQAVRDFHQGHGDSYASAALFLRALGVLTADGRLDKAAWLQRTFR